MDSVRIQGCNAILVFIRSFEGVTSENCPSLESLRDGFIFATIYNQMTNPPNMFDTSLLRHPADGNDWPTCLMNLTRLYCHIEPQLELLNFNYYIDLCKIAKDEDIDQILFENNGKSLYYKILKANSENKIRPALLKRIRKYTIEQNLKMSDDEIIDIL